MVGEQRFFLGKTYNLFIFLGFEIFSRFKTRKFEEMSRNIAENWFKMVRKLKVWTKNTVWRRLRRARKEKQSILDVFGWISKNIGFQKPNKKHCGRTHFTVSHEAETAGIVRVARRQDFIDQPELWFQIYFCASWVDPVPTTSAKPFELGIGDSTDVVGPEMFQEYKNIIFFPGFR